LAQIVNDAAIQAHTAFPDRFVAGIAVPVRDPAMALKEINRVAGKPGMRAIHLPNSIEQRDYLFEPEFEPIFARAPELGSVVSSSRWRSELLQQAPRGTAEPDELAWLHVRACNNGSEVRHNRHAR